MRKRREALLGQTLPSAYKQVHRALFLNLLKKACRHICRYCGESVDRPEDLQLEHFEDWEKAPDPAKAYFNTDLLGTFHKSCAKAHRHGAPTSDNHRLMRLAQQVYRNQPHRKEQERRRNQKRYQRMKLNQEL